MKVIFVIGLLLHVVLASPLTQQVKETEENWNLIPDSDGNLHMVDINSPPVEVEPVFNPINDIFFLLFTQSNPTVGQRIAINNVAQLAASNFNPAHQTRILIHGWNGSQASNGNPLQTSAFLSRGPFNIFVVDWGAGAQADYITARGRVGEAGAVVGQFIDFLNAARNIPFSSISVLGFSLGAHVAGFAGRSATRGRIASIVASDPALPLFSFDNPAGRVNSNDALYVESIHTDGSRLGFAQPIGIAAFYPNWGQDQTGCGADPVGQCSHNRAFQYMAESIRNPNAFWGTRCSGFPAIQARQCPSAGPSQPMGGEPVNTGANGLYFMPTNGASPFGQGWRP